MKIFLFIIFIFFLQGCGIKVDVGSSAIVQDGVQAPTLLTLVTPTSNVSFVDTPMITVSGVTIGDTITVYSDNCSTVIGMAVATATTVNITTSALPEGSYNLKANASRAELVSSCSTSSLSYTVDTTAPTVTSISRIPLDDTYLTNPGENLEFTVNFSKNVTVTGVPALTLELDGINNWRRAVYVSGTTTNELLFRYTTVPSDSDTNGIALNSNWDFTLGSLANAASASVSTSLPVPMIPNLSGVLINKSLYCSMFFL